MSINTVGLFTLGQWFSSGTSSPGKIFRTPAIYAIAVALALLYTDTRLPDFLFKTCDIVGGLVIPLMLLALGGALAKLRIKTLRTTLGLVGAKLLVGLIVGLGVSWLLQLQGTCRDVFILECLLPVAVFQLSLGRTLRQRPGRGGQPDYRPPPWPLWWSYPSPWRCSCRQR